MLQTLKESKVFNLAVFIVRYKGGKNIGPVRYQIFKDLTKAAVKLIPEAVKFGKDFQHSDRHLLEALDVAAEKLKQ